MSKCVFFKPGLIRSSGLDPRDAILDYVLHDFPVVIGTQEIDLSPKIPDPIQDQGDTSKCVGEYCMALKGWQDQRVNFNPLFVYNLRVDAGTDDGMSVRNALMILHKVGIATTSDYPITEALLDKNDANIPNRISRDVLKKAALHKILAYGRIFSVQVVVQILKLSEMYYDHNNDQKGLLAGPLSLVCPVYNNSATFWKPENNQERLMGYHDVTVVGTHPTKRWLKIRNSWGSQWADNGYGYMPYNDWKYVVECWFATNDAQLSTKLLQEVSKNKHWHNLHDGNVDVNNSMFAASLPSKREEEKGIKLNSEFNFFNNHLRLKKSIYSTFTTILNAPVQELTNVAKKVEKETTELIETIEKETKEQIHNLKKMTFYGFNMFRK